MNRYRYNCCMIYQNYPNNPAMEEIKKIRERKNCKKIYPETKREIGATPERVINKSRKYAIFLGNQRDVVANAFETDIRHAAQNTSNSRKKKILYTILEGSQNDSNVQKVKDIFEQCEVPDKQCQFIKYGPEKVEKYINSTSNLGYFRIFVLFSIIISMVVFVLCNFSDNIVLLQEILVEGKKVWEWFEELVSYVTSLIPEGKTEISESSIEHITAIITVIPIPIVWLVFVHREHVSPNPLFWVRFRRFMLLIVLLLITLVYVGVFLFEIPRSNDITSSVPRFDFKRKVVADIIGHEEDIYITVNDVLAPQGNIWIEQNGIEVYSSAAAEKIENSRDNTFDVHMQLCPELNEGADYIIEWNLDLVKPGKQSFVYNSEESVVVYMEPDPNLEEVHAITKDKLLEIASDVGISCSDSIRMCVQSDDVVIPIDISMVDNTDTLFCVDIGMMYLILKDDVHERKVTFTNNGSLQYQKREDVEISDGNFAVTIEFEK